MVKFDFYQLTVYYYVNSKVTRYKNLHTETRYFPSFSPQLAESVDFYLFASGYKCNTILLLHFCGDDGDDDAIKSAILSIAILSIAPKSV